MLSARLSTFFLMSSKLCCFVDTHYTLYSAPTQVPNSFSQGIFIHPGFVPRGVRRYRNDLPRKVPRRGITEEFDNSFHAHLSSAVVFPVIVSARGQVQCRFQLASAAALFVFA